MYLITNKQQLAPNVTLLKVVAPRISEIRQPGQFVIVRKGPLSERIPLTIADGDRDTGTITLVIQAVGKSTIELAALNIGDTLQDVAGPLGRPTELIESGRAVCVGGGVGTAVVHPIAQGLKALGVEVINIVGGRSKEWVIFEDELKALGETIVCTDDGSYGMKGFVTHALEGVLKAGMVDAVYAVGPVPMMKNVSAMTKDHKVHTIVSLNPIMIDGTGMCGGCRVSVGGKTQFACVDGPEFDAHQVDFAELTERLSSYRDYEKVALERYEEGCRLGLDAPTEIPDFGDHPLKNNFVSDEVVLSYGNSPTNKEKMKIGRQKMPEQHAEERRTNFSEVNLGFDAKLALLEAQRCIQCKEKQCIAGCPVLIDIPLFIKHITEGNIEAAANVLLRDNALPAVTGRVCPQEVQCEAVCIRGVKGAPVAIGYLERYLADWARQHDELITVSKPAPTGKKVAIVGSGPAGLTTAGELVKLGHDITIFEAFHKPGGVLVYGIPEFRLPKAIVKEEVDRLLRQGVKLELNAVIGKTYTLNDLRNRFDAIFVANGAGLPVFMGVPGENLKGVYSANEYLTRVNLMAAYSFPYADTPVLKAQHVAVVGGGNVAMDAVRTAKRLGAEQSTIVYRRSRAEMPARVEEVDHAAEEGIVFEMLVAPVEVLGDEKGWVKGMRCQRMALGEPDASGRRRPIPIEGSDFVVPCDVLVVAVGTKANPLLTATCPDLALNKWGNIVADDYGKTSLKGVWAGGDITRGAATVILAMGDGKKSAGSMHQYLSEGVW
jgi:glutamate synthase (NADPH/NADH) small chain